MRGNFFKMNMVRFDIKNKLFTMKVMKYWNRLPNEVMGATSLESFEVSLYGVLSNLTVQDVGTSWLGICTT